MAGMIINTVAVGSMRGVLFQSNQIIKYKLDKKGRLVTSKVDQAILKELLKLEKDHSIGSQIIGILILILKMVLIRWKKSNFNT
ncbi:hypothetical protein CM15mP43_13040 [bacterium]|nr:MAG: hypothetical protein CM15mP43_13040 [bacterium]